MTTIVLLSDNPRITSSTNESVPGINRMRVNLVNGWAVSIIRGHGTYGGDDKLFEVLAIDPEGVMRTEEIFGWLTEPEVVQVVHAISMLDV